MIGRVDRTTSTYLLAALLALGDNDGVGLARNWIRLGTPTPRADSAGFTADITRMAPAWADASLDELDFAVSLMSLVRASSARGVQTPPSVIALIGKSLGNLEGSVRALHPDLKLPKIAARVTPDIFLATARHILNPAQITRTILEAIPAAARAPALLPDLLRHTPPTRKTPTTQ
ncbi:hypothetical protein [Streptomyces sp. NPDC054874]